ncbi:MAG: amidase family protein, partial [Patescibacteria group bacterium]
ILQDYSNAFAEVDVILGPTTPTPAFGLGEKRDPLSMYLADIFTIPANLAGICGLSMPCGKIDDMPIGLQILGNQKQEQKIFAAAKLLEETGVRK